MTAWTGPAIVTVSRWGELPAERKLPGTLRVLVGGQHAGGIKHRDGIWFAYWHTTATRGGDRTSDHPSAEEAVRAVARSGWARRLGAREASPVHRSPAARRLAGHREEVTR